MKKLIFAFAAAAFMAAPVLSFAGIQTDHPAEIVLQEQDKEKKEVDINQLPAGITAALTGAEYANWTPKKAWKIKTDEGWVYKVKLKNGDEKKKVKFTKDGKLVKNMPS